MTILTYANATINLPAEQFFEALYGMNAPGCRVIWTRQDKLSRWFTAGDAQGAATCSLELADNYDVYFGVGLQERQLSSNQRGKADGVVAIPGLWLDVDCPGGTHAAVNLPTEGEAQEFWGAFPLQPSVAVHTGGGIHVYWLFSQPWVFQGAEDRSQAANMISRFQKAFISLAATRGWKLDNTSDLSRVLRVPGTWNRKGAKPLPVEVRGWEPDRRYDPSEVEQAIRDLEAEAAFIELSKKSTYHGAAPDASAILDRCAFIRHCRDDADRLPEPEWYVLLTIMARTDGGTEICHDMSQSHPRYSVQETAKKICHAMEDTGPATCARIRADFGTYCADCRERVASPAVLGLRTKASTEEPWPEPEEINMQLLPVEPMSAEFIPEPLRGWAVDVAHRMQCPVDFTAVGAVVTISSVIGAGCGIRPKRKDDWTVAPNEWGGPVARPSMLKTPSLAEIMKPLLRLEKKAKEKFEAESLFFEAEAEAFKAQKEALKSEMVQAAKGKPKGGIPAPRLEDVKQRYAELEAAPAPTRRRFKTNDATIEKLGELMNENPRGLLVFRDELIGLLCSWDREDRKQDRAFYLEAWNGTGSSTVDRVVRGTVDTENCCVSILGGIQPSKLMGYLAQAADNIANDGMIQRFQLLVYPDEPKEWELVDEWPDKEAKNRAFQVYERLADMDFVAVGAELPEGETIPFFRFSEVAQEIFYGWLTELEAKLRGEENPVMVEHLAKYRSLMPSLALTSHLVTIADGGAGGPVSREAAERAAAWCEYLESHARRIYGLLGGGGAVLELAKKVQGGKVKDGFTVREIYHEKRWHLLNKKEVVDAACRELIDAGWLRREDVAVPGQRAKHTYRINPKIFS